jgi:N-acetylmuramoyl-L-alanine amidase
MSQHTPVTPVRPHSLRILVVQGHRNTSGGDPREAARTPAVANAITAALNAAGHDAACLQNDDGSADNWFAGSLDAVGREIDARHRRRPIDLMLDVHFEGDPANTRGVFTIVPDGDGLQTMTRYAGSDALAANTLDHVMGRAIARAVALHTGLPLRTRGVVEPGVMSERQTHVGGDLGWRLAMFGYTAPARERMVRLIIECGNIRSDAAIIARPDFPARVARGVVAGIAQARSAAPSVGGGGATGATFPPFGTARELREARLTHVTVDAVHARQWAETTQPIRGVWQEGRKFWTRGWIIGETVAGNPVWWITGKKQKADLRWRVWSGGTDLAGADVLALPVT